MKRVKNLRAVISYRAQVFGILQTYYLLPVAILQVNNLLPVNILQANNLLPVVGFQGNIALGSKA